MKLRSLCFLWCVGMLGQTPEARMHFENARVFQEHDGAGDSVAEAERQFHLALKADPNCAEARVGLAQLAEDRAQWTEAIELLRRAVLGSPRNRLALDQLAWSLTSGNHQPTDVMWREAMGYWSRLIGMDKNGPGKGS
jgi:Flp pilus assembly protein TadD